jgi:hypothetical protein
MTTPKLPTSDYTMTRLEELKPAESTTTLVYGNSGTGKTYFAGTAGTRTLFLDSGDGIESLKSPLFKKMINANPIIINVGEKIGKLGVVNDASAFDILCEEIDKALAQIPNEFDTIVVDDLTAIRTFAMNKALEINSATGKSQTLQNIVKQFNVAIPAVQDYGLEMTIIKWFLQSYCSIAKDNKKHFIVTAHERRTYTKGNKIGDVPSLTKIGVGVTGQTFPDDIPALFDNVWHSEVVGGGDNVRYQLRTQGDEIVTAKTRQGGVFEVIEKNPNFLSMLQRLQDGIARKGK